MLRVANKNWRKKLTAAGHDFATVGIGVVIVGVSIAAVVAGVARIAHGALAPQIIRPTTKSPSTPLTMGMALGNTLWALPPKQLDAELQDIASIGFTWIRTDIDWSVVQPSSAGDYNWAAYDRIVASANAHHLHVLGVLAYTPLWARQSQCADSPKCAPANVQDFAIFARTAVKRYAPKGLSYWEIWNEPNNPDFWQPAPNPTAYAALLKTAYATIKATAPDMHVISGGLSPQADQTPSISPRTFLAGMYASGAGRYFDALGDHPYSYPALPNVIYDWSGWSQMADTTVSLRSLMNANGDESKQIWATEYGAPTGGPGDVVAAGNFRTDLHADHVNEQFQVDFAQQSVAAYKTYPSVGPLFWYTYKDLGAGQGTNENFFGIIRADGTQKPLYAALKQLLGH
ncbi:MAG TPA: cellulase family glycosylhydrolase [Candidatus Saccharimonas sp.]|nr:cellulase family glycosylhydrolase [Candidatus Saccharimonas sp.]